MIGSLVAFGLAWVGTFVLVRYVLSRVWPPRGYDTTVRAQDPAVGWVTMRTTTSRGIWPWAPHIASTVALLEAVIVGLLR